MISKLLTYARRLKQEKGASTIEFALVATVFLTFVMGIIEFSIVLFTGALLEQAVLEVSRFGITGADEEGKSREELIIEIVQEKTLGFIKIEDVEIETKIYPTFDDVGKPEPFTDTNENGAYDPGEPFEDVNNSGTWEPDMGSAGLGESDDIVLYNLTYTAGSLSGFLDPLIGDITHSSTVAVKNEPF